MGPDKTTDVKAEGNSRGWEKHNFIVKHQCWVSALRRSSLMADLTCSSTERFVLCSSAHVTTSADFGNLGFGILYLNKAEETPPDEPGTRCQLALCQMFFFLQHNLFVLAPASQLCGAPHRSPEVPTLPLGSLMLTEGRGETEKEIARKMRKRFFWFPFFP